MRELVVVTRLDPHREFITTMDFNDNTGEPTMAIGYGTMNTGQIYSNPPASSPPRPISMVEGLLGQATGNTQDLLNIENRLCRLRDKLFGMPPATAESKVEMPDPVGILYEVQKQQGHTTAALHRIEGLLTEIESLSGL